MNPTALDILKEGGTITFADGYGFTGDPATGYLFIGHEEVGHLATWHLDKVGLDNAFGQLDQFRRKAKREGKIRKAR